MAQQTIVINYPIEYDIEYNRKLLEERQPLVFYDGNRLLIIFQLYKEKNVPFDLSQYEMYMSVYKTQELDKTVAMYSSTENQILFKNRSFGLFELNTPCALPMGDYSYKLFLVHQIERDSTIVDKGFFSIK